MRMRVWIAVAMAALWAACSESKVNEGEPGSDSGSEQSEGGSSDTGFGGNGEGSTPEEGGADSAGEAGEDAGEEGSSGCTENLQCPQDKPICGPQGQCVECTEAANCPPGLGCVNFQCQEDVCVPDSRTCVGNKVNVCLASGDGYEEIDCSPGTCEEGECKGCTPGSVQCDGPTLLECDAELLTYVEKDDCGQAKLCNEQIGGCTECFPQEGKCEGNNAMKCADDGSGFVLDQVCPSGSSCLAGKCKSACSEDIKENSNVGCDYWAADLDNFRQTDGSSSAADAQYAIVVSNTSDAAAEVVVSGSPSDPYELSAVVPPKGLHIFNLPPRNVEGTGKAPLGWRVQSNQPIVAYQFNPLENVGVFSNDASVLFPSSTWGNEYLVMTWKQYLPGTSLPTANGYVAVMGGFENTEVTVTPSGPTRAGAGVPALAAGQAWTTTIGPFDVLSIESAGEGVDLTGTRVVANKPIGVFGGHECAFTSDETCCCDHLEEQMIPVPAWGKTYIAMRSAKRYNESDHWRILASEDDTFVTTNPSQGPPIILDAGDFFDLSSKQTFQIDANKPVMVGQFLASSFELTGSCSAGCAPQTTCDPFQGLCFASNPFCSGTGQSSCLAGHTCVSGQCEPIGDPAFILAPPVEQFLSEYVFLVPNQYVNDYLGVVAPAGAQIILDGNQTLALQPIGPGAAWSTVVLPISDGTHTISSVNEVKFGIVVHGYDDDVSYGYTGGLGLATLD